MITTTETTYQALKLDNSISLAESSKRLIAGFTLSMMKKPDQFAPGQFPIYLAKGEGAVVTDIDGNTYIDFICGLAANTLGHNHPAMTDAITKTLPQGLLHSLPTPLEVDAANAVVNMIPGAEMTRFFKTGADANSAAVRLARYLTGKEEIVTVGYNGWHDQYMFDTPGVPEVLTQLTHRLPLMVEEQEQAVFDLLTERSNSIAAIVLSLPYNRVVSPKFLQTLRDICSQENILFIWDEIVTGFRIALGGAQEYYGVKADLVTLSKGLAAGMPLSAVCGSTEIMEKMEKLQVSTTFGGETLSLAACLAALETYRTTQYIEHIARLGQQLKIAVNQTAQALGVPLRVQGYDPIPMFMFAKDPQTHVKYAVPFIAEMAKRGVLLRREVNFISGAHTQAQIETTVKAVEESLQAMLANRLFASHPSAEVS